MGTERDTCRMSDSKICSPSIDSIEGHLRMMFPSFDGGLV
jgi:hypothetical protein